MKQQGGIAKETRLSEIEGLSIWIQSRLNQEGIDNVQNLATADVPALVVGTSYAVTQIIDWIDQAILLAHMNDAHFAALESANVTRASELLTNTCTDENLKELAEYGKNHELRLAHWGLGAVPTLIAMNVAKLGGFKWKETAYKKLNPLLVVKGDADVITFSTPGIRDYVEAGKMKILACMLPNRLPQYPEVATVKEQGFGVGYSIWFGAFVPAETPDDIAEKLSTTFFNVMAKPDIQDVIKKVGVIPHPIGPQEARDQMDSELQAFGDIMKELGIIK